MPKLAGTVSNPESVVRKIGARFLVNLAPIVEVRYRKKTAGGQSEGRRNVVGNLLLTGGTGKFRRIRGVLHYTTVIDPSKGYNESKTEGEYWFEKD
jgi:hypothetical protein